MQISLARTLASLLAVVLLCAAWAQPRYAELRRDIEGLTSPAEAMIRVRDPQYQLPPDVERYMRDVPREPRERFLTTLRELLDETIRHQESRPLQPIPEETVQNRKNSLPIPDRGPREGSNWMQEAVTAFWNWVGSLFENRELIELPPPPAQTIAPWVTLLSWVALGLVVALGLYFAIRFALAHRQKRRIRPVAALLTEEEALVPLDEWLRSADNFIKSGQTREAIRCLYIACLVRLDDAEVLELRRHETNWEHLRRFNALAERPDFDLRSATQLFDRVWYGMDVRGQFEAANLRTRYQALAEQLNGWRAA